MHSEMCFYSCVSAIVFVFDNTSKNIYSHHGKCLEKTLCPYQGFIRTCTPSPPAWGGGRLKISKKCLLGGGGQKFLFWWGRGNFVGGGGARNFEVKIKTA